MKNKLPLVVLVFVLAGIMSFAFLNKRVHQCVDPECNQNLPKIKTPQPQKEIKPPLLNPRPANYQEALSNAQLGKQQMLLVFGADWCVWCKKMDKETFRHPDMQTTLNDFIYLHVDVDKDPDVAGKYKVVGKSIPRYMLVDGEERVKKEGNGYKAVPEMKQWLGR